ncbi:MAG: 7-cyano-7-deazaguanine synthase QueC [Chloroflexi bacterium]|nr:7-cyano-7-deazaguanine synthase QueC [Chloroflexota bacterium]
MRKVGVILLSGGLDSTTVAAYARNQGYELVAVTLHYGQKHLREVDSARKVARALDIKQRVVDVSFFKDLAWYSALTSSQDFAVPQQRDSEQMARDIPVTYVPLRNTFFITLAAAFLESEALDIIERHGVAPADLEASVFIAANAIDYSGYPDCRPAFYEAMARSLFLGSKLGAQYGRQIKIETPIISKTKAEIVRLAFELKAPIVHTWSCYEGGEAPCGRCDSCILRARGFAEAGYDDPAIAGAGKARKNVKGKQAG